MVPETTALSTELQVHKKLELLNYQCANASTLKKYSTLFAGCKVFSFDGIFMGNSDNSALLRCIYKNAFCNLLRYLLDFVKADKI